jgi:peptidoglycan/LPS O-acetylase OafA/YrhL
MNTRRLEFLDALRGLAAVYVVVYHMLLLPQPNLTAPGWAAPVALAGGTGVTLFFIVSAFSLCYTMPLRLRERNPAASFYLHRFFRIAPLFYCLVAASLVRDLWAFDVRHTAWEIAASLTLVFNLVPLWQESFVWAGWTIGVEAVFYAVFPLLYRRITSVGRAAAFIIVCVLAWTAIQVGLAHSGLPDAWEQSILYWSAFKHFPIFATGILVYHAFARAQRNGQNAGSHRIGNAFTVAGLIAFGALLRGWFPDIFGSSYYWQGLVFGCLFIGLALSPWRLFVNGTTRYLGKISYSVYLNHPMIVVLLAPAYHWLYGAAPSVTVAFLASLALTFSVVTPISAATYRFIEEPGILLGKKAAARLRGRERAESLPAAAN